MGCGEGVGEYRPRAAQQRVLWRAMQEGFPPVVEEAENRGGLPKRIVDEVFRYLACGDVRLGHAEVECSKCAQASRVPFSCKSRLCPSCNSRRAEQAALELGELLPEVAFRQWTLSLPRSLRWPVVRQPGLVSIIERRLVKSVWRWQRQKLRQQKDSHRGDDTEVLRGGAVAFVQLFGSALQLTPHLHVCVYPPDCTQLTRA